MRKLESKITIFIGSFFLVSFSLSFLVWLWWSRMYIVGTDINFFKAVPAVLCLIALVSIILTWVIGKLTKGRL